MNTKTGIAGFLILSLAIAGCITEQNPPQTSQTTWLSYQPIQCGQNPWEVWHKGLNLTYIRAPTEEEIVKEYYKTVYTIEILEYKNIPGEPGMVVCLACNCARGDTIQIKIYQKDADQLNQLGWKESAEVLRGTLRGKISISPICPVEKNPPDPNCQPSTETYRSRVFQVFNAATNQKVTTFFGNEKGEYSIELAPGKYRVQLDDPFNRFSKNVTIAANQETTLDIDIDTGIR